MPIDPFDPGTSVAQHFPPQEPDTFRRLAQIIAAQDRKMFDLRASVLANVSDIVGDLTATMTDLAAANVTLTAQQATLTAQVADIAALVGTQVYPQVASAWVQSFAITPTPTVYKSVTFTTPAGYTRVLIASVATGMGYNATASSDWLYVAAKPGTLPGGSEVYAGVTVDNGVSLAVPYFSLLTDLTSGQVITVSIKMRTGIGTWPADTGNVARIDAQATFLR